MKMVDKENEKEAEEEESATVDTGKGNKYETTPVIERAREERERMEKATEAQKLENDRSEQIMAKSALGGETSGRPQEEKPKELTDTEYAEALERGEVNPLKEDGLV